MGWFSITSTIRSGSGTNVPFALDVAEAETIDEFSEILIRDGCVVGDRYRVHNPRNGMEGQLTDKRRTLVTAEGIASVTEFGGVENFTVCQ